MREVGLLLGVSLCVSRDIPAGRLLAAMKSGQFVQFRNPQPFEIANFMHKLQMKHRADELQCFIVREYDNDEETRNKFAALIGVTPTFLERDVA